MEAAAREAEPRYFKLIRLLCEQTDKEFDYITAGDPGHKYNGEHHLAWHFFADNQHFYMIDLESEAIMFENETNSEIARLKNSESIN